MTDIQVEYDEPIPIYCDNTSAISISKNPVMHSKMKHIPIKYKFLPEYVVEKNIRVEYVGTKEFGLCYPKGKDLSLIAYTNVDWAGCIDDRRSTSGEEF